MTQPCKYCWYSIWYHMMKFYSLALDLQFFMCLFREDLCLKTLLHLLHWKVSLELWIVLICCFKLDLRVNFLPHSWHVLPSQFWSARWSSTSCMENIVCLHSGHFHSDLNVSFIASNCLLKRPCFSRSCLRTVSFLVETKSQWLHLISLSSLFPQYWYKIGLICYEISK